MPRRTAQIERDEMAERLRALEGRLEWMRSAASVVHFWREWNELQEWWAHADHNDEAIRILDTMRENAAWERARRRLLKAGAAKREGRYELARRLHEEGRAFLEHDWSVMYRREPVPYVPPLDDS